MPSIADLLWFSRPNRKATAFVVLSRGRRPVARGKATTWRLRCSSSCEMMTATTDPLRVPARAPTPCCAAAPSNRRRGVAPVLASAPSLAASHATLAGSRSHVLRLAGSSPPCHGGSWLVEPWRYESTGERNEWLREAREMSQRYFQPTLLTIKPLAIL